MAILTFGEGWHNNHHAHAQAARHGIAWYEIDVNWYGICGLKALGLAWDIKLPKLTQPERKEPGSESVGALPAFKAAAEVAVAPVVSGD